MINPWNNIPLYNDDFTYTPITREKLLHKYNTLRNTHHFVLPELFTEPHTRDATYNNPNTNEKITHIDDLPLIRHVPFDDASALSAEIELAESVLAHLAPDNNIEFIIYAKRLSKLRKRL